MNFRKPLLGAALALLCAAGYAAVDVNTASQDELQDIKGVGPAMSGKIVEERKSGTFKNWSDLQARVKGVGPGSATKLSAEGLTVGGAIYGAAAAAAAAPTPAPAQGQKPPQRVKAVKPVTDATPKK